MLNRLKTPPLNLMSEKHQKVYGQVSEEMSHTHFSIICCAALELLFGTRALEFRV